MTMLHSTVGLSFRSKLDGLFLLQTGPTMSGAAFLALGGIGGVVVTGDHGKSGLTSSSAAAVKELRRLAPDFFLMWDSEPYTQVEATKDAPFFLPAAGLFGPISLADRLADQRGMGVSVALTPTGHLQALDVDALQAVITTANAEPGDDIVVHLPLDEAWLVARSYRYVLEAVRESRHPIAISLASDRNPTSSAEASVALQHLAIESAVPLLLLRCDLEGLDFIARGGTAAAFGMSSKLRHGVSRAKSGRKFDVRDQRPSLAIEHFLSYMRPKRIEVDYASAIAPTCGCDECRGLPLDRFTDDDASHASARRHNALVALALHSRMTSSVDRLGTWREMVNEAQGNYFAESLVLGNKKFVEPGQFKVWAR